MVIEVNIYLENYYRLFAVAKSQPWSQVKIDVWRRMRVFVHVCQLNNERAALVSTREL